MRPYSLTAVTRFGLGPRPGDVAEAAADPKAFVLAQLLRPEATFISAEGLMAQPELAERYLDVSARASEARDAFKRGEIDQDELTAAYRNRGQVTSETFLSEALARYNHGVVTDFPLLERLVLFWANHFSVQMDKSSLLRMTAGNFERETIRPHVLGFFSDMLWAAVTHPSMLEYLDNTRSIGPTSLAAERIRRRNPGKNPDINENLGREVLELHTLGVGGGYTQADVREMAFVLTGWGSSEYHPNKRGHYTQSFHEPGERTILGVRYPQGDQEQLAAVLKDLAVHPATARHLSGKLARSFIRDGVTEALIDRLADRYLETGGDLTELTLALLDEDEAWTTPPAKAVPPYDFVVSVGRALSATYDRGRAVGGASAALGQTIWGAQSPAGYPMDDNAFLGGDAFLERIDYARAATRRFGQRVDPRRLADDLFGATLDPYARDAIRRAESAQQGLVILLMSPQLHRR